MLFWNRLKVIIGSGTTATCLCGCSALNPIFSPKATTTEAMDIVATAVDSANLWWPIMFAGFLALVAGTVNLVFLRGGAKLLVIGVLLALTPPIAELVLTSIMPWVSLVVGLLGLALLGIVFGRWFGRKDIIERVALRESFIRNAEPTSLDNLEVADVLKHVGDNDFNPEYKVK
jgi:hypothetical protein|tara:strand:+ start:2379 stop:2900 length:522 start_codon:yes stop_codon:yes gene_type:complete